MAIEPEAIEPDHPELREVDALRDKLSMMKQAFVLAGIIVALQSAIMITVLLQNR